MKKIIEIMEKLREETPEKTITDAQYLNIMNYINFDNPVMEVKRLGMLCKKFDIPTAYVLPRSKYKEAMKYLNSGEWNEEIR